MKIQDYAGQVAVTTRNANDNNVELEFMDKNTFELEITDIAYGGDGIGRKDGFVYFVRGAAPGEKILARETQKKKSFGRATIMEILRISQKRTAPPCPLAYTAGKQIFCPGCSYQHLEYEEEIIIKNSQFISFIKKAFPELDDKKIAAPLKCPKDFNYRNKITLHSQNGKLGYFSEDNKTVLDIQECAIAAPQINSLIMEYREKNPVNTKDENITFRLTESEGAFYFSTGDVTEDKIIQENTSIGVFQLPAKSFFQVNPFSMELLLNEISEIFGKLGTQCMLDIYCGCGIFTVLAAKKGIRHAIGIDIDSRSIKYAVLNSQKHRVAYKCSFRSGRAEDLFRKNPPDIPPEKTLVLLDPPRAGIGNEMAELLLKKNCRWLLYVSCAPDILSRDLAKLRTGYEIEHAVMLDMFPRTSQFESIVLCKARK